MSGDSSFCSPCCVGILARIPRLPGRAPPGLWSKQPVRFPSTPSSPTARVSHFRPAQNVRDPQLTPLYALIALSPESTQQLQGPTTSNFFPILNKSPTEHLLPNLKMTTSDKDTYKTQPNFKRSKYAILYRLLHIGHNLFKSYAIDTLKRLTRISCFKGRSLKNKYSKLDNSYRRYF